MHALRHVTNKLMELELEERLLNALKKESSRVRASDLERFHEFYGTSSSTCFCPKLFKICWMSYVTQTLEMC